MTPLVEILVHIIAVVDLPLACTTRVGSGALKFLKSYVKATSVARKLGATSDSFDPTYLRLLGCSSASTRFLHKWLITRPRLLQIKILTVSWIPCARPQPQTHLGPMRQK
jgi:hypothetical protein